MPTVTRTRARNADAIENALTAERRAVPVGLRVVTRPIEAYLKLKVSEPYPPASAPGTPAHRRTGTYQRGWKVTARGTTLRIANAVRYAGFLEFGTKKMAARPALRVGAPNGRNLVRLAGRTAADSARRLPTPRTGGQ